ncbi:MAG: PilW family protein [Gammaproteobacteria bacterium]|nr:PilW family protein [Gammaproteobacteria bacterium]
MKMMSSRIYRQAGLTLIELMVSLVLGLVLMAGVIQLFAANKTSYQLTGQISAMQENARYAMSRLERDIRMAGYTGCTGRDQEGVVINIEFTASSQFTPDNGVEGWEASNTSYGNYSVIADDASVSDASSSGWTTAGSTTPVLDSSTNALASSDVIRLWHVDGDGVLVDVSGSTVSAGSTPPYAAADTMMLTDCTNADIAHVCSLSGNDASLNCATNGSLSLLNSDGGAHAFKLAGWVYYIGKRGGTATNPPSLFRREISANGVAGTAQELVEGVEALQLQYGVDTGTVPDGVADAYVNANQVTDWNNVVSVRVHLLMQSDSDNVVDGSQTFSFNGATVTASDGRLRYPFVATVSLRNRSR